MIRTGIGLRKERVALTFDDGQAASIRLLLRTERKRRHMPPFSYGENIEGKEELVKWMQAEGHLIGNHTYNHGAVQNLQGGSPNRNRSHQSEIYDITGEYPMWLRPPYGEWQKNLDFYVNMFPVLWDIDTLDWKSQNVNAVMQIVESEIEDGAVDSDARRSTELCGCSPSDRGSADGTGV